MAKEPAPSTLPSHGSLVLPSVEIDSYNLEIENGEGFIGDKANKGAFREIIERIREPLRAKGDDPLGETPSQEMTKKQLDGVLASGDPEAAAVIQGAIEEFAQDFARVIKRFLKTKDWRDTECITVGGGFRGRRVGELAIGRCAIILKAEGVPIEVDLIRHDPDEAGLIGAAHLLPPWMLTGYEGIIGVDIGGTNIRAGIVQLNLAKAKDLSEAVVFDSDLWRHGDESDVDRNEATGRLKDMLKDLLKSAKKARLSLAPVIGIGCPGLINEDGSIERGAQNLPGNWESSKFNLPHYLREEIPTIGEHDTMVIMHNDAVVQGLSQLPYMRDKKHWGVLTIGTGLGNARFTNRKSD